MGCDSQATAGQIKSTLRTEHGKVFEVKNCPFSLMGVAGSCRDAQLLSVNDELIDRMAVLTDNVDYEYMVKYFYNTIYTILLNNNRIERDQNGNFVNFIGDDFIFAYKDKAYYVAGVDGSVEEIEDYLVIGSGANIAMGVLENNKKKKPKERIIEAIVACNDKTIYVDDNIVIRTT